MGSMLTNPLATRQIVYLTIPEAADNGKLSECGRDERQRYGTHGFGSLAEQKKTIRD